MTAYANERLSSKKGTFEVELSSLNRRVREINCTLPRRYRFFEQEVRKWIEAKVARGQINLTLLLLDEPIGEMRVRPNLPLARGLFGAWQELGRALDLPLHFDLAFLKDQEELFLIEEPQKEGEVPSELKELVERTLAQFLKQREKEGELLQREILSRLKEIQQSLSRIEELVPRIVERGEARLRERCRDFLALPETDLALQREILLLADKLDCSEELTRFKSHLADFSSLITASLPAGEAKGKRLDFTLQEMMREINTLGNKAQDALVGQQVVCIKTLLEEIREQVQNIE